MKAIFRTLTLAWPLVIFLTLPALTGAEPVFQAWVQRYNGVFNGYGFATAVATDGNNNVIAAGAAYGGITALDYSIVKYSDSGVPLWTNHYNGPQNGDEAAYAVAVDSNNDVIVTGGYLFPYASLSDYATIKYSSAGVPLWTNVYSGSANGDDDATAVAVDGSNNVIVTGQSLGSDGAYDYATIKYSSAGVPLWTNRYDGAGGIDAAIAVVVDGSNSVIVTGSSDTGGFIYEYTTIKYSSAGVPLWTNRLGGPMHPDGQFNALAVDSSNNVVVMGQSLGSGGSDDYVTIKYSSAGVPLWTNVYDGPMRDRDQPRAVAVDGSNNVIVTGSSLGPPDFYLDYATIKYSSTGIPLWTNHYNGPAQNMDQATALAVDRSNNVFVAGYSLGIGSGDDYATIKYSSAGVPLWTNRYDGPARFRDRVTAVALNRNGGVIVTGQSLGSGGNYDFATVKYVTVVPPPTMTGLQLTNGSFQMRVDDVLQSCKVVIEVSTALGGWSPVFTNTTPANVLFYTDPDAGNHLERFYRAFQFP